MKNLKVKTDLLFPFVFVGLVITLIAFLLIKNNMEEKISKVGDVLVMNYTGRLENGTVFDSNVLPEFNHVQPFEFMLGAGQVIQGWDEGLVGMKIGDKKTLVVPPEKGYGDRAVGNIIPANSTLIFEVELVGIK
ncbi:MAG: FKBP-type peptidyl-prolyl cis-trans isomerase [Candidatus Moranbacteria bacterium]|nr:FKBP-type peptidyl-prolyl cis-trans isomerase [Candidatus Moranbacteria bacterium]